MPECFYRASILRNFRRFPLKTCGNDNPFPYNLKSPVENFNRIKILWKRKKMKSRLKIRILLVLICFLTFTNLNAQWNEYRNYGTVITSWQKIIGYLNTAINNIFLYSYDSGENQWRQIAFQIDEKDGGSDYFISPNLTVDTNDEIRFMEKDTGNKAKTRQ